MWETQLRFLGREDPLAKGMATHSSILARESHGQRKLTGYNPRGLKESDIEQGHFHFHGNIIFHCLISNKAKPTCHIFWWKGIPGS